MPTSAKSLRRPSSTPYPPLRSTSEWSGKRCSTTHPAGQGFLTTAAALTSRPRTPTPESPPSHRGRPLRPGTDRFHTVQSPPSLSDEILPTPTPLPLTTRAENPILLYNHIVFSSRRRYHEGQASRRGLLSIRTTLHFPCVTTVSPIDKACFVSLNEAVSSNIHVVPNGVSPQLLDYHFKDEEIANAIAFSGSLDFPPNSTAVYYFYERVLYHVVYRRYKSRRENDAISQGARRYRGDRLNAGYLRRYSAQTMVINPMGQWVYQNKGWKSGAAPVTSRQPARVDGASVHSFHAEGEQFAVEIIKYLGDKGGERIGRAGRRLILDHYTWSQAGTSYLHLISQALAARSPSV